MVLHLLHEKCGVDWKLAILKIKVDCKCTWAFTSIALVHWKTSTRVGIHFHCACKFNTEKLEHMWDSLVRVPRRVKNLESLYECFSHIITERTSVAHITVVADSIVTNKTSLAHATVDTNDEPCHFFFGHVCKNERRRRVCTENMCSSWVKFKPQRLSTSFGLDSQGFAHGLRHHDPLNRKSYQSANPYNVRTWWVFQCDMSRKDACVIWWRIMWHIGLTTPHNYVDISDTFTPPDPVSTMQPVSRFFFLASSKFAHQGKTVLVMFT